MIKPKQRGGYMNQAETEAWMKETGQYDAWIEKRRLLDEELRKRELDYARAEAPLVEELHAVGIHLQSVWDLVNTDDCYTEAIPVLLTHLDRPYPAAIREGIARALAVPEAADAWAVLAAAYRTETNFQVKDGLAVAVSNTAGRDHLEEVVSMLSDRSLGPSRVLMLRILRSIDKTRANAILEKLSDDPDLSKEVDAIQRKQAQRANARRKAKKSKE